MDGNEVMERGGEEGRKRRNEGKKEVKKRKNGGSTERTNEQTNERREYKSVKIEGCRGERDTEIETERESKKGEERK